MNPPHGASLERRLQAFQAAGRLPSVVAAHFTADGVRDSAVVAPAEDPATWAGAETAYRIGSITKTFTAVLLVRLRDAGHLDLDHPLGRFVPESGYADRSLRDLLSHAAGVQAEPVGPWWERSDGVDAYTLIAANDASLAVYGPTAGAGAYYHYSNLAYGLLGEVIARLRGGSWWDAVRSELIEPLGLHRTTYEPVAPHAQGYSVGHFSGVLATEPHSDTRAMAAAGQLWSTVGDLALWARVLAGLEPEILSPSSAAEMAAPALDPHYGLGLRRVDVAGRTLVGHTGSMPGFLASLFVEQGTGFGVAALANATVGLDCTAVPGLLLGEMPEPSVAPWLPTDQVPVEAEPLLGLWFWGNTAFDFRWQSDAAGGRIEVRTVYNANLAYEFTRHDDGTWRGVSGYLRGERLVVEPDGLECATFVFTREPRTGP